MISLFIYCLDRGKSASDLAIMDIGTGYFARLGLDTDFLVPFVRAITSLAYESDASTRADERHAQGGMATIPSLGDDFWQPSILDMEALMQLEDWSTFSRTDPAQMTSERIC